MRPQHWGTLRKVAPGGYCAIVNQTDTFAIKTVKVNQNDTLIDLHRDGRERDSAIPPPFCLKLVSSGCKHPVITASILAPWIRPSPLTVASKPLEKCDKVTAKLQAKQK